MAGWLRIEALLAVQATNSAVMGSNVAALRIMPRRSGAWAQLLRRHLERAIAKVRRSVIAAIVPPSQTMSVPVR